MDRPRGTCNHSPQLTSFPASHHLGMFLLSSTGRGLAQRAQGSILRTAQMGQSGAHSQPKHSGGRGRRCGSSGSYLATQGV